MSENVNPEVPVPQEPLPPLEERIRLVLEALDTEQAAELRPIIPQWSSGETAAVLEALPLPARCQLWAEVPEDYRGEVLAWLGDQVRASLLKELEVDEAVAATATVETADLALVVDEASEELREAILESLDPDARALLDEVLTYPEDSAGRLMTREWLAIRADVRLEVVQRYLHARGSLPHRTTALMVVDREGVFLGKVPLEALLTKDPDLMVLAEPRPDR